MTKYTSLLLLCLTFQVFKPVRAQQGFTHYNVDEGLSQSSVYSIFQDSKGFMWFGTGDGLNRFDGYHFGSYKANPGSNQGLSNSFIAGAMLEDSLHNLWFGTRMGGLNRYIRKEDRFEQLNIYREAADNDFDGVLVGFDSRGRLWFLRGSNMLACYEKNRRLVIHVPMPAHILYTADGPNRMAKLVDDTIFFLGNRQLVSYAIGSGRFDMHLEEELKHSGSIYTVSLFYEREKRTLWIGTEKGVLQYQLRNRSCKWIDLSSLHEAPVASVLVKDAYNRLWIGTYRSGLLCYDLNYGTLKTYTHTTSDPSSISFNTIRTLFIDRSENLWVGTDGGGVNKLDLKPRRFPHYAANTFTKCFYEDREKNVWIGTHEDGIHILNRKTGAIKYLRQKTSFGNIVSCITTDLCGHLIIGSGNGVDYYANGNFTPVPILPVPEKVESNNFVYHMLHTRERTTLIATRLGLYEARYRDGKLDTFRQVKGALTLLIRMHQSRDGRIWAAPQGSSELFVFRYVNDSLKLLNRILPKASVHAFQEDSLANILWMASERGLIRYDLAKEQFRYITTADGLADNYLYAVLADEAGKLWLSSNKGLICYHPLTGACRNYNVTDGLQSNEFNTGAFYKSTTGELFFGGIKGFNAFHPSRIRHNPFAPLLTLTSIRINDGTVPYSLAEKEILQLPYDSSTLSFDFSGLEFTNSSRNRYRYLLEGWDQEWVEAGHARFARYSNLPPGHYTFRVQACNNDEIWSGKVSLLRFEILPPFWKRLWFILLLSLLLVLTGVSLVRQLIAHRLREQVREFEKQQAVLRERERISKDMHDDLGSGLSRIAIQSELLKHKLKQNENAEQQADRIVSASRELVDNLSEIVWAMNPAHDSIQSLISYLREFASDLFEESDTRCRFIWPDTIHHIPLTSEVRRNIYLILKEALHNVYKHAGAGEVTLAFRHEQATIVFSVLDNGRGLDASGGRALGNGLDNMRKRARVLGATLSLGPAPGGGTLVKLSLNPGIT